MSIEQILLFLKQIAWEQIILFSLMISALYALVAMGFTMIFGVAGILNLAHGAFIMVSAYTAYVSHSVFHLNLYVSFAIAVGFTALTAVAFYEGIHRFARLILALSAGLGIFFGLAALLGSEDPTRTIATASLLGLSGLVASYLFGRKPQGLIAVAIATSVGYLGYLCLLVPLDPLWTLLVFIGIAVLIFLWGRVGSVAKLQWEHAIFFPLTSAVVSWAHFVMGKPILESLLAGIPIGLLFTVGVVRYIQQSPVITLIVTLAMALLIEQLVIVFFRYDAQLLPPFVEATLNVHTDPGALYVAIGQAIILSLVLGLWAYRLLSAYLGRGRALRWIGAILLFFVLEHSLMMGLEGRFEPATSADLGIFFVGLGVTLSLALALALHRYLARNAILYSWLISLVMGLGILIEQIAFVYYAWDIQSVFYLFGINRVQDLKLDMNRLVLFAVAALIIGLFWYFVQRTRTGKAILATSMDQEGAAHVGIDVRRVYTLTWALSGAMAGIAGVFLAAWLPMLPFMWRDPLIISFAIVVLGGLGSLKGSLLAAGIIGFAETLTAYTNPLRVYLNQPSNPFEQPYYFDFLGLSWVGVPSLFILVLILFLRPKGLFGREFE